MAEAVLGEDTGYWRIIPGDMDIPLMGRLGLSGRLAAAFTEVLSLRILGNSYPGCCIDAPQEARGWLTRASPVGR